MFLRFYFSIYIYFCFSKINILPARIGNLFDVFFFFFFFTSKLSGFFHNDENPIRKELTTKMYA